jgi:hypothetical protein
MKYFTRLKIYKASNVTFNPETVSAISYDWWQFVRKIDGKIVFNSYRYSVTTAKHQRQVRQLLNELGLVIHLDVRTRKSLDTFETIAEIKKEHGYEVQNEIDRENFKRIERNRKARERRALKRAQPVNFPPLRLVVNR